MIKTFSTVQMREIGQVLYSTWDEHKNEIKLSSRDLYSLISLKKKIENELSIIEETIATLASQFGAVPQENGTMLIPEEQREAAGIALAEFSNNQVDIDYEEIKLREDSYLPIDIYEALFDFVAFAD